MKDIVTFNLSINIRNIMIGKIILVFIGGLILGYYYDADISADNEKAETMTLEEYTANFDQYRAELMVDEGSLREHIVCMTFSVIAIFCLYEGIGTISGWIIGRIITAFHKDRTSFNPSPPNQ